MNKSVLHRTSGAVVCLALAACLTSNAMSQEPAGDGVPRVFGAFVPLGSIDWEDPASTALVAHPQLVATDSFRFQSHDPNDPADITPEWLAGSVWFSAEATHVTRGKTDEGAYAWMEDGENGAVPPGGARAITGPDGDVIVLGRFYVKHETNATICGIDCGYKVIGEDDGVSPPPTGASGLFYIGCGLFSK